MARGPAYIKSAPAYTSRHITLSLILAYSNLFFDIFYSIFTYEMDALDILELD